MNANNKSKKSAAHGPLGMYYPTFWINQWRPRPSSCYLAQILHCNSITRMQNIGWEISTGGASAVSTRVWRVDVWAQKWRTNGNESREKNTIARPRVVQNHADSLNKSRITRSCQSDQTNREFLGEMRCELSARIFELRVSKHMESVRNAQIFSTSEWYKTYVGSN